MAMATTTIQLNPQEVERDEEEQIYNPATGRMTRRSAKKRGRGENTANDVSSTLSSSSINCFDDFPDEETTMKLISWIGTIQITSKVILINLSNVNTMNNTFDVELDIILETTNAQDVVVVLNDDVSSNQKKKSSSSSSSSSSPSTSSSPPLKNSPQKNSPQKNSPQKNSPQKNSPKKNSPQKNSPNKKNSSPLTSSTRNSSSSSKSSHNSLPSMVMTTDATTDQHLKLTLLNFEPRMTLINLIKTKTWNRWSKQLENNEMRFFYRISGTFQKERRSTTPSSSSSSSSPPELAVLMTTLIKGRSENVRRLKILHESGENEVFIRDHHVVVVAIREQPVVEMTEDEEE